jgi:predicted chitinase
MTTGSFPQINEEQLCQIVPNLTREKAATLVAPINKAMMEGEINTPLRQAAFIAQIAHETGEFRWFCELGNDAYFKRYDSRKDLGNTEAGDGLRYRGRGFIQISGRATYASAAQDLKIDLVNNPQEAESPEIGARIAAWFWKSHDLNSYADKDDFNNITRRINGSLAGFEDRRAYYERAKKVLAEA